MPAASGCTTSKLRSSLWIFRMVSRRCLRFISCQWPGSVRHVSFVVFSCGLGCMLTSLRQIQRGPARSAKPTQSPQRGRAAILFRTTPATIHTIAKTGAMLIFGQERSNEKTALAAEPCCVPDCSSATPWSSSSLTQFQAPTTTPKGWPLLISNFKFPCFLVADAAFGSLVALAGVDLEFLFFSFLVHHRERAASGRD